MRKDGLATDQDRAEEWNADSCLFQKICGWGPRDYNALCVGGADFRSFWNKRYALWYSAFPLDAIAGTAGGEINAADNRAIGTPQWQSDGF